MVLSHLSHIKGLLVNGISMETNHLLLNYNHLVKHLTFNQNMDYHQ